MTIGIGVLGSEKKKPDHIVLISDTMGSYEDTFSTSELHKGFVLSRCGLYAVAADSVDRAAEVIATIDEMASRLPKDRSYGEVLKSVVDSVHGYKADRFGSECGGNFIFNRDEWFQVMDPDFRAHILETWVNFDIGFELIIGGFSRKGDYYGQAFLLYVSPQGKVIPINFPGIAAIGTGADNAMFWMNYRKHKLSCSVKRAAYHAYEAKLMAEKSAHVNERVEIIIANVEKRWEVRQDRIPQDDCPVSLKELQEMYVKYGPQNTADLDPPDQGAKKTY
jgi:20S proteasome alpha/beta subunit